MDVSQPTPDLFAQTEQVFTVATGHRQPSPQSSLQELEKPADLCSGDPVLVDLLVCAASHSSHLSLPTC